MSDIKKVVVEEFDDEGNLVKRTTTEYDETGRAAGAPAWPYVKPFVGDVWPYGYGQIITYSTDDTQYVKIGSDTVRKDRVEN